MKTKIEIFDECYAELSSEGKKNVDQAVADIMVVLAQHEASYNQTHHKRDGQPFKMRVGEVGAKELLIGLMMSGAI